MKKENIFKSIIVVIGTGLSYLKYNFLKFLDFEQLGTVIIVCILTFLLTIFILNSYLYSLKTIVINPKIRRIFSKFKITKRPKKDKPKKSVLKINSRIGFKKSWASEKILWVLGATSFGVLSGFYFKSFDTRALSMAAVKNTEWQSELHLKRLKAGNGFFELDRMGGYGGFDYNWLALVLVVLSIILIYFIIKKTTILSILKTKIDPYLK